jgi:hypothetical protein
VILVGREIRRGVIERREVKFGHKSHTRYDGTPMQ